MKNVIGYDRGSKEWDISDKYKKVLEFVSKVTKVLEKNSDVKKTRQLILI